MTINWVLLCSTEPSFLCEENFQHDMHSGRYTVQITLIDPDRGNLGHLPKAFLLSLFGAVEPKLNTLVDSELFLLNCKFLLMIFFYY